jgi:hypothetical protein
LLASSFLSSKIQFYNKYIGHQLFRSSTDCVNPGNLTVSMTGFLAPWNHVWFMCHVCRLHVCVCVGRGGWTRK